MTTGPFDRAEPLSVLAILRGDLAPPSRRDQHPYEALFAYLAARCPVMPTAECPSADVHFDAVLAGLLAAGFVTRLNLLQARKVDGAAMVEATRVRVGTILGRARSHEEYLSGGAVILEVEDIEDAMRALSDATRLRQHCALALFESGDMDAGAELADDAELQIAAGNLAFLPFAVGVRQILATPGNLPTWRPGDGPIGATWQCINRGNRVLAQRARATAGKAARDTQGGDGTEDDRAGIVRLADLGPSSPDPEPEPEDAPIPEAPGVVVFPAAIADGIGKGDNQRELQRFLGTSLGARLPLVPVPDNWDEWESGLVAESPWLAPFVRAVRASQGGRSHWGGGVVCACGGPGAGKSRIARRIAEVSGLRFTRFNCDSTSDNSGLGGTSIRWNSAHPGVVERMLAAAACGNGMVLLDEIEKAAGSRRNGGGDPHDLMHGLFEPETARAWRSPYLLSEIDVSHVVYLCTANATDGIPSSLLDRMRVVHVRDPGPEHLGLLAPSLAREACRAFGLDERWGDLDGEEISALADVWRGGSIRKLARLVEAILSVRDGAPVARH